MTPAETRSLCPYCGVGCGLLVRTEGGRVTKVSGDPLYPVNRGRTCRKPLELPSAVHAPDRATVPLIRSDRDARFEQRNWDDALAELAARLTAIVSDHGPDALGFYISGQLLTEDYYVANKLVKGFLATNNLDSNSRLCMSSAVAGYTGAFGSDGPPPSYADIGLADCLFLLGTNTAACHPILFSRILDRQREGAFVICVDPRRTPTAAAADLHLPIRPGTDLALLNAMLSVIEEEGLADREFIASHTTGWVDAIGTAAQWPPERAARTCRVEARLILEAARRFAAAPAALALWSMGANQSTVGTLKNRALINLCLATGNLGRRGCGPLSLTGQPNAMGGRETGGLAHLLPGYRRVEDAAHRAEIERHWQTPAPISPRPGLSAVELFEAAAAGRVKALWIVATNPIVSMPDSDLVAAALRRAELVVVQDAHHPTETSALADAVLPAAAWPEKQGTMTNSERRVGLVRRAIPPPGQAWPDWRIFAGLARALGHEDRFAWRDESEVYEEFARCTAGRLCDVSAVSHGRLRREGSVQWPEGAQQLYERGRVATPDGRARFAPTPHADPVDTTDATLPLRLTTGRVADQWHTMTRTGKSSTLRLAASEPLLELHPEDAMRSGVMDGERALISSRRGALAARVKVTDAIAPGTAFLPFHWGAAHGQPGAGAVNGATSRATDPVSKQPELKAVAVRVRAAGPRAARRGDGRRLVIVGGGMTGLAVAEAALGRRGDVRVTILAEEDEAPYNRILVSKLLARTCGRGELDLRPRAWYEAHGIELRTGCPARAIDLEARAVRDAQGARHEYDTLVLATGSRAVRPPIPGIEAGHVHVFRAPADVAALTAAGPGRAVVIGGGLLGLEAAAGLLSRGARVTVVELASRLMPAQLDPGAAEMLARTLERLGLRFRLGRSVAEIAPDHVRLDDGERIDAALVVAAAGVRPETSLARAAGIECARGVVVDDQLRTSAPGVLAAGECAEHRGIVYGLWAPLAEQARVAGATAVGDPAAFHGTTPATTLKVAGVDLFAGGFAGRPDCDEVVFADTRRQRYRKLVLDGDRLVAAMLVGDVADARTLSELLRTGAPVPETVLAPGTAAAVAAQSDPDALVCSCNAVSYGTVLAAIRRGGLATVAQLGNATRAGTGCGGCGSDLEALLASSSAGNIGETGSKSRDASMVA